MASYIPLDHCHSRSNLAYSESEPIPSVDDARHIQLNPLSMLCIAVGLSLFCVTCVTPVTIRDPLAPPACPEPSAIVPILGVSMTPMIAFASRALSGVLRCNGGGRREGRHGGRGRRLAGTSRAVRLNGLQNKGDGRSARNYYKGLSVQEYNQRTKNPRDRTK